MNNHNLDDLILDDMHTKKRRTKNLLTFIALGLIVLIIAVILTKLILKDPTETLTQKERIDDYIDPDLTLDRDILASKQTASKQDKQTLPTQKQPTQPAQTDKPAPKAALHQTPPKPIHTKQQSQTPPTKPAQTRQSPSPSPKHTQTAATKQSTAPEKTKPIPKVAITDEFSQHKIPKPSSTPTAKPTHPKPAHPQATSKPAHPTPKPNTPKPTPKKGFYIQVGSFTQNPSRQFLSILEKNGYRYRITAPNAKGLKKLQVGPYENRQAAELALPRVKDRINKGAFIVAP